MKQKVLVVDDQQIILRGMKTFLEGNGYSAAAAESGKRCLEMLQDGYRPDVILMDLDLGIDEELDGIETAERILNEEKYHIPIVFISGHTDKNTVERVKAVTHYGLVQKTSGNEEFILAALDAAIEVFRSEQYYKNIVELSPYGIITADTKGKVTSINRTFEKLSGYSKKEIEGKHFTGIPKYARLLTKIFEGELMGEPIEFAWRRKDGEERTGEAYAAPVKVGDKTIGLQALVFDITERKEREHAAEALVREKDFLLREMHHRIKNNLAMILSLINLKSREMPEGMDLKDLISQINAIRLVHEKLQTGDAVSTIDFPRYARELIVTLLNTWEELKVSLDFYMDDIALDSKTALSLGLIMNEIVLNALKHGFSGTETDKQEQSPKIKVELTENTKKEMYHLYITNNGAPFPENIDLQNPGTLGLRLVSAMSEQIGGFVELVKQPHPEFNLYFPISGD
jgi:PAS domain S-box-containing protein